MQINEARIICLNLKLSENNENINQINFEKKNIYIYIRDAIAITNYMPKLLNEFDKIIINLSEKLLSRKKFINYFKLI